MIRTVSTCILLSICATAAGEEFHNVPADGDIPVVVEGDQFTTTIPFRNLNDRAMRIPPGDKGVDSTCTCTSQELSSRFLLPGEDATLTIEVPTAKRSGAQHQRFWIYATDPDLLSMELHARWRVEPMVAVDLLPPDAKNEDGTPRLDRPESRAYRDIYRYTLYTRPDEPRRFVKNILLSSPEGQRPDEGLEVEVAYDGEIWEFTTRTLDEGRVLLLARANRDAMPFAEQQVEEEVVVRTNHPGKSEIVLHFATAIDEKAGSKGAKDPWTKYR